MNPVRFEETIGVDLEPARRPGTPRFRTPQRWPNSRWPIPQQEGEPAVLREGMPIPPVFSTAIPLRGLSGAMRRLGYRFGDHRALRWMLLLAGDRVEAWGRRAPMLLLLGVPVAAWFGLRTASRLQGKERSRIVLRWSRRLPSRLQALQTLAKIEGAART